MALGRFTAVLFLTSHSAHGRLETADDLSSSYMDIFKTGNRNAASHLWTSYVLERAHTMSLETLENVFKGFCPVSGSPLPDDPRTMYKVVLPAVGGGNVTGVVRHCCWPCICDMNELVRVDTKTLKTASGNKSYHFLVIGDPCKHPERLNAKFVDPFSEQNVSLSDEAPEVKCHDSKLKGAVFSDHGHPIIGMIWTDAKQLSSVPSYSEERKLRSQVSDPTFGYGKVCVLRKRMGYNSGMGLLFHLVAGIAPIPGLPSLPLPEVQDHPEKELIEKASELPMQVVALPGQRRPQLSRYATVVLPFCVGLASMLAAGSLAVLRCRHRAADVTEAEACE